MRESIDIKGHLIYLLQNCQTAFDELRRLNTELQRARQPDAPAEIDVNQIGALHRMVQDYLIIRVVGLFDKKCYTVSFEQKFSGDKNYDNIKQEEIIKYLQKLRGNFAGHEHIKSESPETAKILKSNLLSIFKKLNILLLKENLR